MLREFHGHVGSGNDMTGFVARMCRRHGILCAGELSVDAGWPMSIGQYRANRKLRRLPGAGAGRGK
jgi:hypothetical protein